MSAQPEATTGLVTWVGVEKRKETLGPAEGQGSPRRLPIKLWDWPSPQPLPSRGGSPASVSTALGVPHGASELTAFSSPATWRRDRRTVRGREREAGRMRHRASLGKPVVSLCLSLLICEKVT